MSLKFEKKSIYFASDFHFGAPDLESSRQREIEVCKWLDFIAKDAKSIYLIGDIFDFWFEYSTCIPKGYIRFQAKLIELIEKDIEIHFFYGNHDMWMLNYFVEEIGIKLHKDSYILNENNKTFFMSHGDGLGPGDKGYKLLKKIFRNKFCQWLFARIHPNSGIRIASFFSKTSRGNYNPNDYIFKSWENESIFQFIQKREHNQHADYYILGHRHLPLHLKENNFSYINLGEWIHFQSFARYDGNQLSLLQWKNGQIYNLASQHEV